MEAKFDSEFEKQCMDTMCIYLYTTFFYLNSIYIYITQSLQVPVSI